MTYGFRLDEIRLVSAASYRGRFVSLRKADGASVHRTAGITNMEQKNLKYTYMLKCKDGSLYTGWTTDLDKRVACHNAGKGAKYTRARRPVELVYFEQFQTREEAMRRECEIKKLTRKQKEELIKQKEKHPAY